jgi:hypothetical protein
VTYRTRVLTYEIYPEYGHDVVVVEKVNAKGEVLAAVATFHNELLASRCMMALGSSIEVERDYATRTAQSTPPPEFST